jgi:hypothetical protein
MKIRSTILALSALTTLSVSALAPTQASAWGRHGGYGGGYGGGHHFGGHFGGYRPMSYFRPSYSPYVRYSRAAYTVMPETCDGEEFSPQAYMRER